MATKKPIPSKKGKVAAKPVAKKTVKPAPKKAAPAKKAVKPAAKKAAPAKKAVKPAPKKVAVKPVAKKVDPKKVAKVVAKKPVKAPVVKKAAPKKAIAKAPQKVAQKPVVKAPSKPLSKIKSAPPKPIPVKAVASKQSMPSKKVPQKESALKSPLKPSAILPPKPSMPAKAKDIKVPAPKPVVIPKITTKTVKKYEPDFTKSVLDAAKVEKSSPSQRYSDNELLEFKELILRKMEAAKKELSYLQGLITRKDDMGGDEGDNRYMTMEDGGLSMEREQLSQMASRQITFIDHMEKALMRIENKTYGICRVTGKLIDKARLRAVPHATLSIEAKMGTVK